ncbi:MAG TPA: DUF3826 domain-containing protein [Candidatus Angelobacter sp.]|nr:DUF3826 domain-containing protein [Candidatus Angelobacter sp.]
MKVSLICALAAFILAGNLCSISAQTSAATQPKAVDQEQHTIEKHTRPVLKALKLDDAAKEAKVRDIVWDYTKALDAWHQQNDAQIKALWKDFNQARSKKNEAIANLALEKIDGVYASFRPEHDRFLSELGTVLTPEQVETVKDVLTVKKVEVTYNAYQQIFHGLTDAQKAFILKNLKAAREEAINAGSMNEKSAFFKKYKIKIEAYLTSQGYDVKQSYRDFVAKQKAEAAAKKAAKAAAEDKK